MKIEITNKFGEIQKFLVKSRIIREFTTKLYAELIIRRYVGNNKKRIAEELKVEDSE